MIAQVGYSGAGRSRGRAAPCAVCTWHRETRSASFLVEPQNQGGGGFPGLSLKTGISGLVIWASKSPLQFLVWASKPSGLRFVGCATKPTEDVRRRTRVEI
jgi:hypothetical protein